MSETEHRYNKHGWKKEMYLFKGNFTVFSLEEQMLVWSDDDLAFEKYARRECRVALQNSEHRRHNNVVVHGDNQSCSNSLE